MISQGVARDFVERETIRVFPAISCEVVDNRTDHSQPSREYTRILLLAKIFGLRVNAIETLCIF